MDQAVTTHGLPFPLRSPDQLETDKSALRAVAQAAVNVELFTIPLYMTALYSIQGMHQITGEKQNFYQGRLWPGPATTAAPKTPNEQAFNIIFSVFIEEMLHVQLAANLASRAGVRPTFTSPLLQNDSHGWICYGPDKSVIPHIIDLKDTKNAPDVKVNIGAVSTAQLRLFKVIEQPEEEARKNIKDPSKYFPKVPFENWTKDKTEKNLPMFGTIGWMYRCYLDYMQLRYQIGGAEKTLWECVYDAGAIQRDLFNVEQPGHPKREYLHFDTTVPNSALGQVWKTMSAITDQGEGSELPPPTLAQVDEKYQASQDALKVDYPSYTATGQPAESRDAEARFSNGNRDHYERFTELENLLDDMQIWPEWRTGRSRPWTAKDLVTSSAGANKYGLPEPEAIATAMNDLGTDSSKYDTISKAAVGSIAGITTVLNKYWTDPKVLFPYPSMVGSGDRMAICWALFRKAPDLSQGHGTSGQGTLQHACQGLDLANDGGHSNDCAAVGVFHSCRGSNACKTEGGCGFVQEVKGGGMCGFALVKAKTDGDAPQNGAEKVYSAPGDNKCGALGGCAVPVSASQIFPRGGTMKLFDFDSNNDPVEIGEMPFKRGHKVYDIAYIAYERVMAHRQKKAPSKPAPNDMRLAFPPST